VISSIPTPQVERGSFLVLIDRENEIRKPEYSLSDKTSKKSFGKMSDPCASYLELEASYLFLFNTLLLSSLTQWGYCMYFL
jgi:hypothetical protein